MSRLKFVLSLLLFLFAISSFANSKIALVLDRGGRDDKSFNSAAFRGATEAKQKLGIFLKDIEASDETLFEPAMRSFASKKFDLIIGIGVAQAETIRKLAKEMPQQKFAIVDATIEAPNVKSLIFGEHEGSYLVGAIAAMKSKSGTVGFIGGMDVPLIRRFQMGFEQGAKDMNPRTKVLSNFVGVTGEAWNNPTKAKELATSQYERKADIIFVAAGNSNNGVFDAAVAHQKYAIGVDSNQNYIKPGYILTSMLKRVDSAVFQVIKEVNEGHFKGGTASYGIKDLGVDWALDEYNRKLFTDNDIKKINKIKSDLIAGKIKVQDYYKAHGNH